MTNRRNTKRALMSSVVALALCFTMLLGTTFAWFTDSAATGSNVITAGNLDIDVEYTLDGTNWNKLDGATDLFRKGLWEPGHTEVVVLKIENKGSLALKYAANMNIVEESVGKTRDGKDIVLSDILTVSVQEQQYKDKNGNVVDANFAEWAFEGYVSGRTPVSFKSGNVLMKDVMLEPGAAHWLFVKVDMAETVDNRANHDGVKVPSIEFGVNVLATQYTYEYDSFGNQYDKDASTDDVMIEKDITLTEDSVEPVVIAANESVELDMANKAINNSLTNNGEAFVKDGTIAVEATGFANYGDADLNNVTVNAGTPGTNTYGYAINAYAGSNTVLTDVAVNSANGAIGVTGGAELTFNSGSVEVDSTNTAGRYLFYVVDDGSVVTINGGNFDFNKTQNQRRAYAYVDTGATLYINGGTFGTASTRSGYTAGLLGSGTIVISGGTFGFDPSAWIADGYVAVETNGTWSVVAQ